LERITGHAKPLRNSLAIMALGLLGILVLGCPDPNRQVWFRGGGERSKTYTIHRPDDQVDVTLKNYSFFADSKTRYGLYLRIMTSSESGLESLEFNPEKIQVLFNGRRMDRAGRADSLRIDTLSAQQAEIHARFECPVDTSDIGYDGNGALREVDIDIILDGFLAHEGRPVPFDTVRAVELKTAPLR